MEGLGNTNCKIDWDSVGKVTEVSIFPIDDGKWVVRQYLSGGFRMGDSIYNHKPTEEELKERFGDTLNIIWGYSIIGTEAWKMVNEALEKRNKTADIVRKELGQLI